MPEDPKGLPSPITHPRRAEDPTKGHRRPSPHDLSGPDPSAQVLPGQIAPRLAGDRAKALMVMGRVKGFVEKYSEFAQEKLKAAEPVVDPKTGEKAGRVGAVDPRTGEKIAGREETERRLLPKEKVLQLIDRLPMMPSSQMMFAVKAIGNYIWRVHSTVREGIRGSVRARLHKQGQLPPGQRGGAETPGYQEALRAASKEFEADSVNVKADLNMLSAVSGVLRRSGGFGSKADMTFLDKVMKGYVDDSGQYHVKSVEIRPKAPDVPLTPELQRLSGWEGEPERAPAEKPGAPRARGPVVRKAYQPAKSDVSDEEAEEELRKMGLADSIDRQFDSWINEVIEWAMADRSPKHWDEI